MITKIEELQAAYEKAKKKADESATIARQAKQLMNDEIAAEKIREFEAMGGVVGATRVRIPDWWNDNDTPNMEEGPFLVTGATVGYSNAEFTLAKIKKDGTASAAPIGLNSKRVFIIADDQLKGSDA